MQILHALLSHLADALAAYACYQIEAGAQVVQLFDSWAHHLSPEQFAEFRCERYHDVIVMMGGGGAAVRCAET